MTLEIPYIYNFALVTKLVFISMPLLVTEKIYKKLPNHISKTKNILYFCIRLQVM